MHQPLLCVGKKLKVKLPLNHGKYYIVLLSVIYAVTYLKINFIFKVTPGFVLGFTRNSGIPGKLHCL